MARKLEAKKSPDATPIAEVPHFVIEARPAHIPAALQQLADDARVTYGSGIKHWQSHSDTTAGRLRIQIAETIKRQGEGYFTLDEAAQILTDAGADGDHLSQMLHAWADGDLSVHQGGSRYLRRAGETICTFDDTVTVDDLNKWLQDQTGRGFPAPAAAVSVGCEAKEARSDASEPKVHSTKDKRRRDDLWPVIEEAQRKCRDPKDTAEVWVELTRMADHETGPLLAFTEQRIKWTRNGKTAYLTRDALHKRLNPDTRRSR